MIKMIATDIDGTIVNWEKGISPKVKNSIKKLTKNDVKVVLVTGRMHQATKGVAQELGLNTPIVSYQGGLIKDIDGKTLYQVILPELYAKKIIKWAKNNKVHLNLYMDDELYVENDDYIVQRYVEGKDIPYNVCNFDEIEIHDVNKLLAIDYENPDRVTNWVREFNRKFPELFVVKSSPYFCEIGHFDTRKSKGVEFLMNYWGIKKDEILAIGDQDNDIELLKSGGIAVAMGNGTRALLNEADYITDTVENDGFVEAIEKFVFNKLK